VRIVPTIYYKGVHGFGASFNYAYRPGEVTLASIGSLGGGGFQLLSAEGKFLEMKPRDIAAPQTFFQWDGGGIVAFSETWLRAAPSHHHTAAFGRLNRRIALTAEMLGLPYVQV
jgi:L-arabinose isomerase